MTWRLALAFAVLFAVSSAVAQISIGPDVLNHQRIAPIGPGSLAPFGPGTALGGSSPPASCGGQLILIYSNSCALISLASGAV